jgi:hypothetical protein
MEKAGLAWHSVSSGRPLQSCRQTRFSRHSPSPMHFASATWQFASRQVPTFATSAPVAGPVNDKPLRQQLPCCSAPSACCGCCCHVSRGSRVHTSIVTKISRISSIPASNTIPTAAAAAVCLSAALWPLRASTALDSKLCSPEDSSVLDSEPGRLGWAEKGWISNPNSWARLGCPSPKLARVNMRALCL